MKQFGPCRLPVWEGQFATEVERFVPENNQLIQLASEIGFELLQTVKKPKSDPAKAVELTSYLCTNH